MKHFLILPAVAGAFLLTSCELEEQIEPAEEAYTKAFIKEFGIIDPNQDWNMATRGSVTVNTPSATEVKIYANIDGEYRIAGDFTDVSGAKTLEFDIPRGVTDLMVEAGSWTRAASVGGTVSFANASRVIHLQDGKSTDGIMVEVAKDKNGETLYKTYTENVSTEGSETGVYEYRATLPEDHYNLNEVTQNFHFTSDADKALTFVLYPVYWQTSAVNEIGIAYKVGDEIKHVPVYTIKSGEELCGLGTWSFYNTYNIGKGEDKVTSNEQNSSTTSTIYLTDNADYKDYPIGDLTKDPAQYTKEEKESVKNWVIERLKLPENTEFTTTWGDPHVLIFQTGSVYVGYSGNVWFPLEEKESTKDASDNEYTAYRSQGIQVTIPKSTSFCFYLLSKGSQGTYENTDYMYSRAEWNGDKHVHAATFENKAGDRCLAFEDWYNGPLDAANPNATNSGGGDLNDVVLYTDLVTTSGGGGKIIVDDATTYILAAEDLGNIDDFDFNDIVVSVKHVSGQKTATLKALAAGGTLPVKLCYNGNPVTSPVEGGTEEWHSWFDDGKTPSSTMINTYANSFNASRCHETTIEVPEDFTMAQCKKDENDNPTNMGGFSFVVDRDGDGTFTKTSEVKAPKNGDAPQMICVPGTWLWPTERTNIGIAYTGFGEWGANYTQTDWLKTADSGKVLGPGSAQ